MKEIAAALCHESSPAETCCSELSDSLLLSIFSSLYYAPISLRIQTSRCAEIIYLLVISNGLVLFYILSNLPLMSL